MSPHIELLGATMQAYGLNAIVLPEADERNLLYSDRMTSGKECLPYRVTLGDFMRFYRDDGYGTMDMSDVEGYMAGSFGPCRLGKYALEQRRLLQGVGFDLPIRTTVSNNAYADMGLGAEFERLAWRSVVVTDYLQKMLWGTRPYEKEVGATDQLFRDYFNSIADRIRIREPFDDLLEAASRSFQLLKDTEKPRRPLVGINGEIYLRSNDFSNNHLIRVCEDAGLEVVVSPMGEWIDYVSYRNLEDAIKDRQLSKILSGHLRRWTQRRIEGSIAKPFRSGLDIEEPSVEALLAMSREYLSPRCGSEAVLSIGSGVEWLENPRFAGVISVMPHGCMPGGIVAAMSEKFATMHGKPWINLTYDGSAETNNLVRISNFAEVIRFCHGEVVK
jgi:predicted nucleotide-binding protein (sugar kinase/HSP70/actin superfamily)